MRKKFTVLLICGVALISILLTQTLIAGALSYKPYGRKRASGTWIYVPQSADVRVVDDPSYMFVLGDEVGTWSGTFVGTSYDVFFAVQLPSGTLYAPYALIFFEGTVNGKQGTLVISFAPGTGDWDTFSGEWEILSGTGELENLLGRGTYEGSSSEHNMEYSGWIHFKNDDLNDED